MKGRKNKIKILETIRQGQIGGGESHVFDLTTHLDADRFEPIVLSFTDGPMINNLKKKGIESHVIPSTRLFDPMVYKKVNTLFIEKEFAITHTHGTRAASNLIWPSNNLSIPLKYTVHGWSFNDSQNKLFRYRRKAGERYILNNSTEVICVSASNIETGKTTFSNFQPNLVKNSISFKRFDQNISSATMRKRLGFDEDEIWVGLIARMTFQKDPFTMLEGFHLASQKNDRLRLIMIGEGEHVSNVKKRIKELNLTRKVKKMPFQNDIENYLAAIDIFCLPSLWEGMPIGLIEAMAMKKAVIATAVAGSRELISDKSKGLLIDKNNDIQL